MKKTLTEADLQTKYQKHYDRTVAFRLLKKLRKLTRNKPKLLAKSTGTVLTGLGHLLSALENPAAPVTVKLKIMGAIGYIVSPVDLIPDVVPVVGWADDATAVGLMLNTIKAYSTFNMQDLDDEIDGVVRTGAGGADDAADADVALPAVVQSEMEELERNPDSVDESTLPADGNLSFAQLEANIAKSNELFQQFLEKNAALDADFRDIHESGAKKSDDIWNAISRL